MKNSRPSRFPSTISLAFSGVVSRMSHVRGSASCAIAPAMNTGARMQMSPICRYAMYANDADPAAASFW